MVDIKYTKVKLLAYSAVLLMGYTRMPLAVLFRSVFLFLFLFVVETWHCASYLQLSSSSLLTEEPQFPSTINFSQGAVVNFGLVKDCAGVLISLFCPLFLLE